MRVLKPLLLLVLAVAALLVALVIAAPYIAGSDRVRARLAAEITAVTGKPVTFAGPVDLHLFPALEVSARDVRVANPPGYSQPWLALVGEMSARIAWRPLLRRELAIRDVIVNGLQLALEEGPRGPNWTLPPVEGSDAAGLPTLPDAINLRDATISYRAGTAEPVEVKIETARVDPGGGTGPLSVTLAARFRGERIALDARSGPLDHLLMGKHVALNGQLDLGAMRLTLDGRLTEPLEGRGLDAALVLESPSLSTLSALVGGALPPSAPLRLSVALREGSDGRVALDDLRLSLGASRVEGRLAWQAEGERPRLDVTLRSPGFDLADLLGPDAAPSTTDTSTATLIALPETLPDTPLPFALLRAFDATVALSLDSLRAGGQQIKGLAVDAALDRGRLTVSRLAGTLGEGSVEGRATVDATASPPQLEASLQLSGLDVGALLAQPDVASVGTAHTRLTLKTAGASPRALAAALEAEAVATGIDLRLGAGALPLTLSRASLVFAGAGKPVDLAATGSSRGETLQLTGKLDPLARYGSGQPYAGTAQLKVGRSQASLALAQDPATPGLRLRFDAAGPSLIDLTALAGAPLPLGPYRLAGIARLTPDQVAFSDIAIELPGTKLAADGTLALQGARPSLTLALRGAALDLDALTGALNAPGTQARSRAPVAVLPAFDATPIDPAPLSAMDLALDLDVKALRLAGQSFRTTALALRLKDGTATLAKLTSDFAGAPLSASGRLAAGRDGFDASLIFAGRDLDLGPIAAQFDRLRAVPASRLVVDGKLDTRGRSVRDLVLAATGVATLHGLAVTLGDPRDGIPDIAVDMPRLALTAQGRGQPLLIEGDGTIAGDAASLRGRILSLDDALASRSVPLELALETKGSRIALKGDTPDPAAPLDLTVAVDARGRLLRDFAALGGLDLTPAGPYAAAATLRLTPDRLAARDLAVQVGESRVGGTADLAVSGDRPRLTASLTAPRLRLEDFDHAAAEAGKATPPKTPVLPRARARLLPSDPFPLALLREVDGEVTLRAGSIEGYGVATRDAVFAGTISNGVLTLTDLSGTMEGGRLALRGTVDGRGNTAVVDLAVDSKGVDLGALLGILAQDEGIPTMLKMPVDSTVRLVGAGVNAQGLAATLKGSLRVVGQQGYVRQGGFTFIEGGLLRKLAPWDNRDRTAINCFVGDFTLDRGVATTKALLLDTEYMSVAGTGTIDLGREQANMVLTPRPKEIRLLDLAVPVSVTGPLASPTITPTATGTARRLITTLGVFVNPLVLIVPVIEGVTADRNPCEAAVEKPVAAPPASTAPVPPPQPGGILGGVGRNLNRVFGD